MPMLDIKIETLLAVYEKRNFTKAAELLSLTQPAVSHHIKCLEDELETKLFIRGKGDLRPTPEGEIAVGYAKRFKAMYAKLKREVTGAEAHFNNLRIGITHTAESNFMVEVLAKFSNKKSNVSITVSTDTIKIFMISWRITRLILPLWRASLTIPSCIRSCLIQTTWYV